MSSGIIRNEIGEVTGLYTTWSVYKEIEPCTVFTIERKANGAVDWTWYYTGEKTNKTDFPRQEPVFVGELSDVIKRFTNCRVQILRNTLTGAFSPGWIRTEKTVERRM